MIMVAMKVFFVINNFENDICTINIASFCLCFFMMVMQSHFNLLPYE